MVLYTEDLYDWTQPELMEFNIYNFAIIIAGQTGQHLNMIRDSAFL